MCVVLFLLQKKRTPTEELVELEREKVALKKQKITKMEKMLKVMERNSDTISNIRDFLYEQKGSMFMGINICETEQ